MVSQCPYSRQTADFKFLISTLLCVNVNALLCFLWDETNYGEAVMAALSYDPDFLEAEDHLTRPVWATQWDPISKSEQLCE